MQPKLLPCCSIIIFIIIITCIDFAVSDDLHNKMKAVKDAIFRDYDKSVRPTNGTNTTDVYTAFLPRQIIGLDEEKSLFSLDSYFYMHWYDPRLQWNPSDYDGYLPISKDMVWVPDIYVYNSHSAQVDPFQEVMLIIHSSGHVSYFPPILTQTSCASAFSTPYPQDEVECVVIMGSWVHDGWEINFYQHDEVDLEEFENIHPRWELIKSKTHVERNETYYECCPEPYLSLHAHFSMRRRPVPEIEVTRTPCILVMVLNLCIFWLPPDSSKKLLLGGILFLVLNIMLPYVAWSTKNPLAVLYGVSFVQTAMYIVVITLLVQVMVVIRVASTIGPSRPPALFAQLLTGSFGKYLMLKYPFTSEAKLPIDRVQLKDEPSPTEAISIKEEWMMLASAIDRILFFLMIIVMVAVHHL